MAGSHTSLPQIKYMLYCKCSEQRFLLKPPHVHVAEAQSHTNEYILAMPLPLNQDSKITNSMHAKVPWLSLSIPGQLPWPAYDLDVHINNSTHSPANIHSLTCLPLSGESMEPSAFPYRAFFCKRSATLGLWLEYAP